MIMIFRKNRTVLKKVLLNLTKNLVSKNFLTKIKTRNAKIHRKLIYVKKMKNIYNFNQFLINILFN